MARTVSTRVAWPNVIFNLYSGDTNEINKIEIRHFTNSTIVLKKSKRKLLLNS
jgi:hypothetical protein